MRSHPSTAIYLECPYRLGGGYSLGKILVWEERSFLRSFAVPEISIERGMDAKLWVVEARP
ncbi:hypothetical protein [Phormidium nigroviride]